jgi:hypothetical protein
MSRCLNHAMSAAALRVPLHVKKNTRFLSEANQAGTDGVVACLCRIRKRYPRFLKVTGISHTKLELAVATVIFVML